MLAKKHQTQLDCPSMSIIMTIAQERGLEKTLKDIQRHPSSADLLDMTNNSWLSPMRNATKSVLIANKHLASSL